MSMRRKEKEITERDRIDAIIRGCEVCRLGLAKEGVPYIVPVSFGYDGDSLYFHSAPQGRKIDFFTANELVCFEFEKGVRIVPHADQACGWSCAFECVIGYGRVSEVRGQEEKIVALNHIMRQYSERDWQFDDASLARTRVWRIAVERLSAKESNPEGRS